jgi:polysaccharide biosynthesis protein PslG
LRKILSTLLLVSFIVSACGGPPPATPTQKPTEKSTASKPAPPSPTPLPSVSAPTVNLVQNGRVDPVSAAVHVFLWGHREEADRDLKLAKEAGFTWVKQRFEWRNIEKVRKNEFEWHEPDLVIDKINKSGLGIIARLDNQPDWARKDKIFPASGPPDNIEDWKDFVQDFAERYKGKVQIYEIWNEPNISREWGNLKPDAKAYTEMLRVSYTEIKKIDPNAIIVSAGLSPTTEQSERAISDVVFLREMYANGAKAYFDMLGVHAPGFKAAPDIDPSVVAKDPALTNNDPSPEETKRVYSFRHAEDMRKIMEENGDQAKQVAIMEMGWTTDSRPNSPYAWHSVTPEVQADYLVKAMQYARANWASWAGPMVVLYIPEPAWTANDEQYYWSITNPDGTVRPAYTALKAYLTQNRGPSGASAPSTSASPAPASSPSPAAKP